MQTKNLSTILLFAFVVFTINAQHTEAYQKKHFIQNTDTLLYRILYPQNFDENKKYPVLLFLHGAGERGNDNKKQLTHGSKLFTSEIAKTDFPAIVIFPQCAENDYWSKVKVNRKKSPISLKFKYKKGPTKSLALTMALLDSISSKKYSNKHQVYVMGLSMGGMGTYEILYRKPNTFAAAIPICGGGDPKAVVNYATKTPIWAFHGAEDNVVSPQESLTMVSAILKAKGKPRFTLFENANHNSWDPAFAEPLLLSWLFSHSLN
ncbi:alpha/beta hydrolase-fold protein [Cellulophaga omnivescoria]|uniref:carboxylesterase family protein n=1 Tax=Cellulophaga omnivescoria TaxID=1888890 RepID=UPI0009844DE1|nr:dienelactone hydrolase family protein [Cellulophaga omnivescoria]WBU90617.1 alpha/beta hydrolase-fold protein [Cellulophaga omnivescoria]WKB82739.1 alpha/beta hydrolase-fold protein [Cellulophaga lytica]